jgi:hypothetical protein
VTIGQSTAPIKVPHGAYSFAISRTSEGRSEYIRELNVMLAAWRRPRSQGDCGHLDLSHRGHPYRLIVIVERFLESSVAPGP